MSTIRSLRDEDFDIDLSDSDEDEFGTAADPFSASVS